MTRSEQRRANDRLTCLLQVLSTFRRHSKCPCHQLPGRRIANPHVGSTPFRLAQSPLKRACFRTLPFRIEKPATLRAQPGTAVVGNGSPRTALCRPEVHLGQSPTPPSDDQTADFSRYTARLGGDWIRTLLARVRAEQRKEARAQVILETATQPQLAFFMTPLRLVACPTGHQPPLHQRGYRPPIRRLTSAIFTSVTRSCAD